MLPSFTVSDLAVSLADLLQHVGSYISLSDSRKNSERCTIQNIKTTKRFRADGLDHWDCSSRGVETSYLTTSKGYSNVDQNACDSEYIKRTFKHHAARNRSQE